MGKAGGLDFNAAFVLCLADVRYLDERVVGAFFFGDGRVCFGGDILMYNVHAIPIVNIKDACYLSRKETCTPLPTPRQ